VRRVDSERSVIHPLAKWSSECILVSRSATYRAQEEDMTDIDEKLRQYHTTLDTYTRAVERISADSLAAVGLDAGPQRYSASVVMTRLVVVATSVLFICPDSVLNRGSLLWDFGSVAAPIRSLFETGLMLFYLGTEAVSEDEWELRINIVHLHDCTERIRLFSGLGFHDALARFVPTAVSLRERLTSNPLFASLPKNRQKMIVSGDKPTLFGKGEMLRRMGRDPAPVLDYYRFISNYVHNFPFGFHPTGIQGRDGTVNEADVSYSAEALRWGTEMLDFAANAYEKAFEGIVDFGKQTYDVRVARCGDLLSGQDIALLDKVFGDRRRDGLPNGFDQTYIAGVLAWLTKLLDEAAKTYASMPIGYRADPAVVHEEI